jgi:hypothetical protein
MQRCRVCPLGWMLSYRMNVKKKKVFLMRMKEKTKGGLFNQNEGRIKNE